MLVEAVANMAVVFEASGVIDNGIGAELTNFRNLVGDSLHDKIGALIHAVTPVGFETVTSTNGKEVGEQRCAPNVDTRIGERNRRTGEQTNTGFKFAWVTRIINALKMLHPLPMPMVQNLYPSGPRCQLF